MPNFTICCSPRATSIKYFYAKSNDTQFSKYNNKYHSRGRIYKINIVFIKETSDILIFNHVFVSFGRNGHILWLSFFVGHSRTEYHVMDEIPTFCEKMF